MRHGLLELLLVQPGASAYRPAPDPNAPAIKRALELAERDRAVNLEPKLEPADIEELGLTPGAAKVYWAVRHPEKLQAPPPWPQELALLSATALIAALGGKLTSWRSGLLWGPPWLAATVAFGSLRVRAERRAARRMGLTPLTSPQPTVAVHLAVLAGANAVYGLLRLTGRAERPRRLPWMLLAARDSIRQLDKRRSWRRAYAAAAARSPQACSSAESRTSGGWAPETP